MVLGEAQAFSEDQARAAVLSVDLPRGKVDYKRTELIPLDRGWLARATAERSPALHSEMQALPTVRGTATVARDDVAAALAPAESRALLQALGQALAGDTPFAGR